MTIFPVRTGRYSIRILSARGILVSLLCALLFAAALSPCAAAEAPQMLDAADIPNDDGTAIRLNWQAGASEEDSIDVFRREDSGTGWSLIKTLGGKSTGHTDGGLSRKLTYVYRTESRGGRIALSNPVSPDASFFNTARLVMFAILALYFISVLVYIKLASRGREFFVRRISGLNAIEEAIGRATEMGRPVLYVPGIDDLNNIQTIASMVILGDVARMTASYETPIVVPVCKPFVVPVAEEAVKQGFLNAGRPELYNPDNVRYLSDEQFAFTAGVNGIMLREKTAANIYMGSFFAESLILAETGFSTGAIQVAGTANIHQLPFFVAACDYALIGEELFAASAYLSKEPKLLGTLKASDLAKVMIMILLVLGCITETLGLTAFADLFAAR
jgi:hypothetical protein